MRYADYETLLIVQIETRRGVDNVDEIAAVEGLDVLWIGHNDLTNSMGIPGRFDHPNYLRAIDRFLETCRRHGKAPGIMSTGVDDGRAQLDQGFRCVAYWGGIWLYARVSPIYARADSGLNEPYARRCATSGCSGPGLRRRLSRRFRLRGWPNVPRLPGCRRSRPPRKSPARRLW